ncbi:MAG TPA: adenylate/guanylate cyclase domain-containing protein [Rhizomicrobium sp.]|jgi:adenylate cyclase
MQRKLTVILSADVVGYSGMMEADEEGTLEKLKANRARIFDPHLTIHEGRLFKLMGDGALVEFSSVIAAVNCALAIQDATEKAAQNDAKPIRYRIGINSGEVIVEGDDIYGEGVNVAARIQALAPIGGVAVSRAVRDQIAGKIACAFDDMGEHTVKNIEAPVHVFSARASAAPGAAQMPRADPPQRLSVCVLPFANMSGDVEQEYFSDGISEDIITDLSKVSALSVVSRNSSFMYKGKSVDLPKVARELKVTHVLEGSVRKSGGRVRITAQLIDGGTNDHVWAERYDRDLNDIFALQDEISEAIVAALKLKLLPEEKKAIEKRGTDNVDAYNLYLMARQNYATGLESEVRRIEIIVRLCQRAVEIDPNYARAWALMALGQALLRNTHGQSNDGGLAAAERALALDGNLAEAHAALARIYAENDRMEEAQAEADAAVLLDPESYEANVACANLNFKKRDFESATRFWEKAIALMNTDFRSAGMLVSCYNALGNRSAALKAAQITLDRVEKALAQNQNDGAAIGHGSNALAVLGNAERAKEWMGRALLLDPDNMTMRYNFACALAGYLRESDAAIAMLETFFARGGASLVKHATVDPDLDPLREETRFQQMLADALARVGRERS